MNNFSSSQSFPNVNKCAQPKLTVVVSSEHLLTSPSHVKNQLTRSKEKIRMLKNIQVSPVSSNPSARAISLGSLPSFKTQSNKLDSKVTGSFQRYPLVSYLPFTINRHEKLQVGSHQQPFKDPKNIKRFPLLSNPYVAVGTSGSITSFPTISKLQFLKVSENSQRYPISSNQFLFKSDKISADPLNTVPVVKLPKQPIIIRNSSIVKTNCQFNNQNFKNLSRFFQVFNKKSLCLNQRFPSTENLPKICLNKNQVPNKSLYEHTDSQMYKPVNKYNKIKIDKKTIEGEKPQNFLSLQLSNKTEVVNVTKNILPGPLKSKTFIEQPKFFAKNKKSDLLLKDMSNQLADEELDLQKILPGPLVNEKLRGQMVEDVDAKGKIVKRPAYMQCNCIKIPGYIEEAPYYTHIGAAHSVEKLRLLFQKRTGFPLSAIRMEKIKYTKKEGKTKNGCPVAKWILRRSSDKEKLLVVCRKRPGHFCATSVIAVVLCLWDGISQQLADEAYDINKTMLPIHAEPTNRRCGINNNRTCACQGWDEQSSGASYTFGCSWTMYHNTCKFARSTDIKKFKMTKKTSTEQQEKMQIEEKVEELFARVNYELTKKYKIIAPDAHYNQTEHSNEAFECRIRIKPTVRSPDADTLPLTEPSPFSSVSCCMDFCAHSHRDSTNMERGITAVVTLTKEELRNGRNIKRDIVSEEQYHVLPLYTLDTTDENGHVDMAHESYYLSMSNKVKNGAIEVLSGFQHSVRTYNKPLPANCKKRTKVYLERLENERKGKKRKRISNKISSTNTKKVYKGNKSEICNSKIKSCYMFEDLLDEYEAYWRQNKDFTPYNVNSFNKYVDPNQVYDSQATYQHQNTILNKTPLYEGSQLVNNLPFKEEPLNNGSVISPSGKTNQNKVLRTPNPEFYSESSEVFRSSEFGGVALALTHGSILIECAKKELHATTALLKPNRLHPSRMSLVFYQHKNLNFRHHGKKEQQRKEEIKKANKNMMKFEGTKESSSKFDVLVEMEANDQCHVTYSSNQHAAFHNQPIKVQEKPLYKFNGKYGYNFCK